MTYTVKQLATLAGISVRTLHFYDAIGLLRPAQVGVNGYRSYDEAAVLRLQQILFYKELGLSLDAIRAVLDDPGFELLSALESHRQALQHRLRRLQHLIATVDRTIAHLKGEASMEPKDIFAGFSNEVQAEYAQQAEARGPTVVNTAWQRQVLRGVGRHTQRVGQAHRHMRDAARPWRSCGWSAYGSARSCSRAGLGLEPPRVEEAGDVARPGVESQGHRDLVGHAEHSSGGGDPEEHAPSVEPKQRHGRDEQGDAPELGRVGVAVTEPAVLSPVGEPGEQPRRDHEQDRQGGSDDRSLR
ncbi:MAG: MerR family transcriptional regulator [Chloroflexales bacterium]|nr:MerR family transcriptional regulator [Chloroflexales bacterium]